MLYYAGIGSRETPITTMVLMFQIAQKLQHKWTLRSGGATGADHAFFTGIDKENQNAEIYLPWVGFNNCPTSKQDSRFGHIEPSPAQLEIAEKFHPNWAACTRGARAMHARNVCQILGHDLNTPSDMVICWTPNANQGGGTGQAIRIANSLGIPVFDLADPLTGAKLVDFVKTKSDIDL